MRDGDCVAIGWSELGDLSWLEATTALKRGTPQAIGGEVFRTRRQRLAEPGTRLRVSF